MTRVPRGGGSQEGTTGDLLSHQPEFMGTPLNYYKLRESLEKSPEVYGAGHSVAISVATALDVFSVQSLACYFGWRELASATRRWRRRELYA